jgi:Fur family transcriptional regulator, ferric uptake regulator
MTRNRIIELLSDKSIEITNARVDILYILFRSDKKLVSLQEIVKLQSEKFDRTTIYRTLLTLCNFGLVYKIIDTDNKPFYGIVKRLNAYSNQMTIYSKDCYHFKCRSCKSIVCLVDSSTDFHLPEGFIKTGANLLLTGYCAKCSKQKRNVDHNKL